MKKLSDKHYDIIGFPRLVRLNPNIPWKTRGNGALAFQIGKGTGKKIKIGEVDGKTLYAFHKKKNDVDPFEFSLIKSYVKQTVEYFARVDDTNTNPGFVLLRKRPKQKWYLQAVRSIVSIKDVLSYLDSVDALYEMYKNGRGLIGATAAIAWSSLRDKTYELIAYREQGRWGTKRVVDEKSVKQMDKAYPTTFDNYDYVNRHNRLTPNSPCPILYGIRGDLPKELFSAFSMIHSEHVAGWILFETNQGTDDHLQKKMIRDVEPYQSVVVKGTIHKAPYTIVGGHVFFSIKDTTGIVACAAYEPTKEFRSTIRELVVGDRIVVYGGVREKPLTINIEKINIQHLKTLVKKVENPVCPVCGKHMKSRGTNQGYKCRRCGTSSKNPKILMQQRSLHTGFYEVPVCARRHLSKPLKRMH